MPLQKLVEFADLPLEQRPVIQCLDIPIGNYATTGVEMDSIVIAELFRGELKPDFLGGKPIHSLAGWGTANTAHSHSPTHIDAAGSATASRIVSKGGKKLWVLHVEDGREAAFNIQADKYAGRDVVSIEKYDAILLECGDEM